jgi:hypothetical protein
VTEEEWAGSRGESFPFHFFEERGGRRRLVLFGCACCRRVWDLIPLPAARRLVEIAELFAEGEATEAELLAANASPDFDDMSAQSVGEAGRQFSARVVDTLNAVRCLADPEIDPYYIARKTSDDPSSDFMPYPGGAFGLNRIVGRNNAEWSEKLKLLRDIFGNIPRQLRFDPAWRSSIVVSLAKQMYESRDFSPMPILADALEDAGCDSVEILRHCRGDGPHVRGCFVVDLILEKE